MDARRVTFLFLIGPAESALHDPVDDHGNKEDGEPTQQAGAFGRELQRLKDHLTQSAATDQ